MTDPTVPALDPELASKKIEAEARKAIAEADKAAAEARRAQIEALIPDLTKITGGDTAVAGEQALFSSVLMDRALTASIVEAVSVVVANKTRGQHILITDDADLVGSDAVYLDVTTGLSWLTESAKALLDEETKAAVEEQAGMLAAGFFAPAIAGAVATALPSIVSLLSTSRNVSSYALTADSAAALALAAGKLAGQHYKVHIDNFRLVSSGEVATSEKQLRGLRGDLWKAKLTREYEKSLLDPDNANDVQKIQELAIRIGVIEELVKTIDGFVTAIHTAAPEGKRSPFVTATLYEQLHGTDPQFDYVLYVKVNSGSADQVVSDRPLWWKDKFYAVGSMSVAYWLMDTKTSQIIVGGVASGSAEVKGKIGSSLTVT